MFAVTKLAAVFVCLRISFVIGQCQTKCSQCTSTQVLCSFAFLTAVPTDIPTTVTFVSLTNNRISALGSGVFQNLNRVTGLLLSSNRITTLQPGCFQGLNSLVQLDLSKNSLTTIDICNFNTLRTLQSLDFRYNMIATIGATCADALLAVDTLLSDNPIICDCHLYEFQVWLIGNNLGSAYIKCNDTFLSEYDIGECATDTPNDVMYTTKFSVTPDDPTSIPDDLTSIPNDLTTTSNDVSDASNDLTSNPNDLTSTPNDLTNTPTDASDAPYDLSENLTESLGSSCSLLTVDVSTVLTFVLIRLMLNGCFRILGFN